MTDAYEVATKLGGLPLASVLIFILAVIVITGRRGDWRWKREFDAQDTMITELKRDRDEWKALTMEVRGLTRDAIDLAKHRDSNRRS